MNKKIDITKIANPGKFLFDQQVKINKKLEEKILILKDELKVYRRQSI